MRATRFSTAAVLATAMAIGAPAVSKAATVSTSAPNASFEQQSAGTPSCWTLSGGPATLSSTTDAHSGNTAAWVRGKGSTTGTVELATSRTAACGINVTAGHTYDIGAWYHATGLVTAIAYTHSPQSGWQYWFTGTPFAPSTPWVKTEVVTPAVPKGVDQISVGFTTAASAQLFLDEVAVVDATPEMMSMSTTPPPPFVPAFPATDKLVTNEYAYWNPTKSDAVKSDAWEMTSGSLFSKQGNGFTGTVNVGRPDAKSTNYTDSAIFRLNTKSYNFKDVNVSFKLNIQQFSSTSKTPAVDWDGLHLWLRYQSQYNLYYASVARRDGRVVIKKKCPGGPSNDGTYYELSKELTGYPVGLNQWNDVAASVRTNPTGTVTIVLYRNGKAIVSATDTGVGCATITRPGAVGIRGDNAQLQFGKFTVANL